MPSGVTSARTLAGVCEALLGLQQPVNHQQLTHQVVDGLAGRFASWVAQRPSEKRVGLLSLLGGIRPGSAILAPLHCFIRRRCRVVADDLDDLDGAEGEPQPPQGRELVIIDLGHTTMMPGSA
jgi:hypothetical protein